MKQDAPLNHFLYLLPSETAELARETENAVGIQYGVPLTEAVQHEAPWMSWLDAALLAGYLPDLDSMSMYIKAWHMWTVRKFGEFRAERADGDAEGVATGCAKHYRDLARALESCARELEALEADIPRSVSF